VEISSSRYAEAVVLRPRGRIDHASAAAFESALAPRVADVVKDGGALVLDLAGVDYISSVGLRALMIAAKQMRETPAQLLVASLTPVVAEIFAISRFDRVFNITATLDDALTLCSPEARALFGREAGTGRS